MVMKSQSTVLPVYSMLLPVTYIMHRNKHSQSRNIHGWWGGAKIRGNGLEHRAYARKLKTCRPIPIPKGSDAKISD
jgi:hypothetical protein